MTISGNYASPVTVNGFACKNCTDVDLAKKHIDPAHPEDGPYGLNADRVSARRGPAVIFGGRLVESVTGDRSPVQSLKPSGSRLDISV
jgi:hypothetical protein